MSLKFEYIGTPDEGADLSDRLVVLLGADIILAIGAALAQSTAGGGLAAAFQRLQQAAREMTDARVVAATTAAEKKAAAQLSFTDIVHLMETVAKVDPMALVADGLARAFSPAMSAWKKDVLTHVTIGGKPAREVRISAHERNQIVWTVANAAGFFPWPAGLLAASVDAAGKAMQAAATSPLLTSEQDSPGSTSTP